MFSLLRGQIQYLVRELSSYELYGVAKRKFNLLPKAPVPVNDMGRFHSLAVGPQNPNS